MNRPVRTRTQGGVGAGGGKPPATRFGIINFESIRDILKTSNNIDKKTIY
jgi:hypothetical protein